MSLSNFCTLVRPVFRTSVSAASAPSEEKTYHLPESGRNLVISIPPVNPFRVHFSIFGGKLGDFRLRTRPETVPTPDTAPHFPASALPSPGRTARIVEHRSMT
jgi:hypothetical protein